MSNDAMQLEPGSWLPLAGVRVLEVAGRVAGSYAGRVLRQLGAHVTRVDVPWTAYAQPGVLPALRAVLDEGKATVAAGDSAALAAAVGAVEVAIFDSLLDDRGNGSAREISAVIRGLIDPTTRIVEISDFGCDTPWPGSGVAASAWAGMTFATGAPGREPLSLPGDLADFLAGVHGAGVALASLLDTSGDGGPASDVSVADVLGYIVLMIVNNFIPYGRPWLRDGPRATQSGGCYPGAIFESSDGPIMIMCRQQSEWNGLVKAMGSPEWTTLPRFQDPREIARESSAEADSHLIPWVGARTKDELRRLGHQFGFPTAPVRSVGAAIEDPQFTFRRFFVEGSGELAGLTYPGVPWRILQASPASEPAPDTSAPGQPLAGLRVLDLSWVWSGPMVTSILADLGAEVFKVENPERPDPARARGPARRDGVPVSGPQLELSPYFNQLGHGKKSINIDLTKDEGRELVLELARHCDVVVENMRPGVMKRLGIGYDELRKVNQRVVMLSMSTLGQEGPSSQIMGYGMVMSGLAGLESIVGYGDETMGMFNLAISDPTAGSHAIVALLAAIHRQRVDGQSAWIDLSQTECTMEALLEQILETQLNGSTVVPGNSHTSFSPHGVFRSAGNDEWIAVAARTDAERDRMRDLIGGGADLDESLEKWLVSRTAADAATDLRSIGVSASPVMSFEALEADGWFERRGFVRDLGHPDLGPQTIGAAPWSLNGHRISPSRSSPYLGEHGREILATVLGLDTRAIDELVGRGVVGEPSPGADRARNNFDERQEA